eukprot:3939408-Rhodomonas_salina.1
MGERGEEREKERREEIGRRREEEIARRRRRRRRQQRDLGAARRRKEQKAIREEERQREQGRHLQCQGQRTAVAPKAAEVGQIHRTCCPPSTVAKRHVHRVPELGRRLGGPDLGHAVGVDAEPCHDL